MYAENRSKPPIPVRLAEKEDELPTKPE